MNCKENLVVNADNNVALPLCEYVSEAMANYFERLDGDMPGNIYQMVLEQVELPLLRRVMAYVSNNQSKAAAILGLSRGTLRKKLKECKLIK